MVGVSASGTGRDIPSASQVRAWDLPTRLFKWLLVACIVCAWATNKYATEHPEWHKWNGYAALVLITFRVFWGFVGGSTSRFSAFVASPQATLAYAWSQSSGRARQYLGHNPLGAWMILALMAVVFLQAGLGLYSADPDHLILEGPLSHTIADATVDSVTSIHRLVFNVILALAAAHIVANLLHALLRRDGLILGMITGWRPQADYVDQREAIPGSPLAALACLVLAMIVVFGGMTLLGGRFW
jgi:cytochrome b